MAIPPSAINGLKKAQKEIEELTSRFLKKQEEKKSISLDDAKTHFIALVNLYHDPLKKLGDKHAKTQQAYLDEKRALNTIMIMRNVDGFKGIMDEAIEKHGSATALNGRINQLKPSLERLKHIADNSQLLTDSSYVISCIDSYKSMALEAGNIFERQIKSARKLTEHLKQIREISFPELQVTFNKPRP